MSRPVGKSKKTPAYCLHKSSGSAFVTLDGKPVYLGSYGTPENRAAYDKTIVETGRQNMILCFRFSEIEYPTYREI
jgi:hypothetical protein